MSEIFIAGGTPLWVIALIGLGALALLIVHFLGLKKRLGLKKSSLIVSLRGLVYALLIFFLLTPILVEKRPTKLRPPLAVLIDSSQSMGFPASMDQGQDRKSRIDLVKARLLEGQTPWIQRLAETYDVRLYHFGTDLEPINIESLRQLDARGKGSRLFETLREAGRQTPAAALVFSDGIANGENHSLDESFSSPFPVFTIGVGETQGYADIRIAEVAVPEFAFRGREFKLDLAIQAHGFAGKTVPLYLNRGRNLVSRHQVMIDRDPFEKRITLSYTPKELGLHSFSLSLPPQPGEAIAHNNHKEFKVEVRRDKIRVLTLSGSPSWNYRFLRMALKQDPLIDLVSFVFLRTPTDSVDVPDNRLSLIPFPIDEIFLEELKNFDVLVFDDFSHRSYFNVLYLEKVRDFTRDGGGLAMLGGMRSFDSGGYAESPLREVLPIELDGKGNYLMGARLRAIPTAAGKAHPITRIVPDSRANEEAWKKMPALTTLNQVRRVRGETLLAAGSDGGSATSPLLAVGRFGKGRTLALLSDDFWRWNFVAVGDAETPQNYLKLIRQGVRWLAQEPSFEQVEIQSLAGPRAPGEKIHFKIRVLNDDFSPAAHASIRLWVAGPEGEKIPLEVAPETVEGEYSAEFTPGKEGSYRLEAEAHLQGKLLGKDQRNFLVAFPYGETEDGRPRPDLLKRIAETTRGEFIPISEWNEESIERIAAKLESVAPSRIVERRQVPLWSIPWTFAGIILILGLEWWLRRKWGLV